jgi:hypothetical protein
VKNSSALNFAFTDEKFQGNFLNNSFSFITALLCIKNLDCSHGGFQTHEDEFSDYEFSQNTIPAEDPFRLLTNEKRLEPYFDPNVTQNVTALVGKSAYLNCIVKNLGNKTVE